MISFVEGEMVNVRPVTARMFARRRKHANLRAERSGAHYLGQQLVK
jgi:hypothetical protein